jgi:hypothetical protein
LLAAGLSLVASVAAAAGEGSASTTPPESGAMEGNGVSAHPPRDIKKTIAGIKSPVSRARAEEFEQKSAEVPLLMAAPALMRPLSGPAPRTIQLAVGTRPLAPPFKSIRWELSADAGKSWTTLVAAAPPTQRLEHRFELPGTYLIRPVGSGQDGQVVEGQPITIGITGAGS